MIKLPEIPDSISQKMIDIFGFKHLNSKSGIRTQLALSAAWSEIYGFVTKDLLEQLKERCECGEELGQHSRCKFTLSDIFELASEAEQSPFIGLKKIRENERK